MTEDTPHQHRWGTLGVAMVAAVLAIQLDTRWEWSMLMDEMGFLSWMPRVTNIFTAWLGEIDNYWRAGRFYPFKYFINLVKWRYLPLNPNLFHWVNSAVLVAALFGVAWWATHPENSDFKGNRWNWILFLIGFGLIQRPLLDIIALSTIGESWAAFFFVSGLMCFPQRPILYRLAFLFAAFSKEPAIVALGATALVWGFHAVRAQGRERRHHVISAVMDAAVFVGMSVIYRHVQKTGPYLQHYRLLDLQAIRLFPVACFKIALGLLPAAVYLFSWRRDFLRANMMGEWVCLLFALGYVMLVVGNHAVPGFWLIPGSIALFALTSRWIFMIQPEATGLRWLVFLVIFAITAGFTFYRYGRYARSINESSALLSSLLMTTHPRLIYTNAPEASGSADNEAARLGVPVTVRTLSLSPQTELITRQFKGDVIVVELSCYFGRIGDNVITTIGDWVGGWKMKTRRGSCRIYLGAKQ